MANRGKSDSVEATPHQQMLRLVAKGFYRELVNYGVKEPEILTVAAHLLDNVMTKSPPAGRQAEKYNELFRIGDVTDHWAETRRLTLQDVVVEPFRLEHAPDVASWLEIPKLRDSFYPRFPDTPAELRACLTSPDHDFLGIYFQGRFVGVIGADNIDPVSRKLEMKKLVGDPGMRGRGIGKRATFLFLYHTFVTRRFHKVFLHTLDVNIRNLNLNGNLGFVLEGVFFEEVVVEGARQDIVRMALTEPAWRSLFA